MARLDAQQFSSRRRLSIGEFSIPVPRGDRKGVKKITGRLWYLRASKQVMVRMKLVLAKTHNGRTVSTKWEEAWPGGGDSNNLKAHLQAIVTKYYKKFRAGEWPEEKNYLTHCNAPWTDGFVESTCTGCKASYCTVDR